MEPKEARIAHFPSKSVTLKHTELSKFSGPGDEYLVDILESIKGFLEFCQPRLVWNAIDNGDDEALKDLLPQCENCKDVLEVKDLGGKTSLLQALNYEDKDVSAKMVGILLEWNPNVNTADNCGLTALQLAVQKENWKVAKMLLKHGAGTVVLSPEELQKLRCAVPLADILVKGPLLSGSDSDFDVRKLGPLKTFIGPAKPMLPQSHREVSSGFFATIMSFYILDSSDILDPEKPTSDRGLHEYRRTKKVSVTELVYDIDRGIMGHDQWEDKKLCTWYHLPANNVSR